MKVSELITKLKALDPSSDVVCYCEDESVVADDQGFRLFDIVDATTQEAEQVRLNTGAPYLKLGKTESSARQSLIEISVDF